MTTRYATELMAAFYLALHSGDAKGVEAALLALVGEDPRLAVQLYDALKTAVTVAPYIKELKL